MFDKSHIGHVLPVHTALVEAGRLRFFAKATGEDRPEYLDEAAARAAGFRGLPAPPSFVFSLDNDGGGIMPVVELLGMDLGRILHGEQSFTFHRVACAGDILTFRSRVADIYDKKNGALGFVVRQTDVTDEAGEKVADLCMTLVQRNA